MHFFRLQYMRLPSFNLASEIAVKEMETGDQLIEMARASTVVSDKLML